MALHGARIGLCRKFAIHDSVEGHGAGAGADHRRQDQPNVRLPPPHVRAAIGAADPRWRTFGLILAAMVCARTCAMAFNRIVDRDFDKANPRTVDPSAPR